MASRHTRMLPACADPTRPLSLPPCSSRVSHHASRLLPPYGVSRDVWSLDHRAVRRLLPVFASLLADTTTSGTPCPRGAEAPPAAAAQLSLRARCPLSKVPAASEGIGPPSSPPTWDRRGGHPLAAWPTRPTHRSYPRAPPDCGSAQRSQTRLLSRPYRRYAGRRPRPSPTAH